MDCTIEICRTADAAILRISGRAGVNWSPHLKRVLQGLLAQGCTHFVLDLTRCDLMDSTFLGILLGFAIKTPPGPAGPPKVEIYQPTPRVQALFDTLGVSEYFPQREQLILPESTFETARPDGAPPSKAELAKTSLQAHVDLTTIQPANLPRFKDVIQFLEEDLKQQG